MKTYYLIHETTKEHVLRKPGTPLQCIGYKTVEADSEGWIAHRGNECPLPDDVKCEYRMKNGMQMATIGTTIRNAKNLVWGHKGHRTDITHYRPILEQVEPVQEPVSNTDWNKAVRDSTDKLLAEAGYDPDSSVRHGLAMMIFDKPTPAPDYDPRSVSFNLIDRLKAAHEAAQTIPDLEAELRRELAGMGYTLGMMSHFVEPANSTAVVAEPEAAVETPQDKAIAGALYDFLGFLTTRDKPTSFGATRNSSPAVDLLQEWADKRGLNLKDADVENWRASTEAAAETPQDNKYAAEW